MARNNNNRKSSKGMKRNAQRGIGAYTFEELQQKAAAIKAKTAVNVTTKKPAEAILEVLSTPDQTPGPTPAHTRAPSRSNSEGLDSSIPAQVMCLESELNCESPRGSSSSFLEDEQLQVTGSEGTPAQPFAELSHEGGQLLNSSPVGLLPADKSPAAPTTAAELPAKTTLNKLPEGNAAVAVLTTPLHDNSDTAPTDQSKAETLPDCQEMSSPSLMDIPIRQEDAWLTPSQTSIPLISAAEGTAETPLPPGDLATLAPADEDSPAKPPPAQDTSSEEEEDVPAPATAPTDCEPASVDQRHQGAPTECTKATVPPQPRNWLASTALHTCSWVQAACTRWLGQPRAPKAVMITVQQAAAAPRPDLAAALDTAWHYQLLT
ncbi:g8110 [Coccomyxa elongata]